MSNGEGAGRHDVAGLPVDEAVEVVVDADEDVDAATARSALNYVATEDGMVSPAAAEDALGETATVVSTPETRAELAGMAMADAHETAPDEDLEVVAARFDGYETRLESIRSRLETLGADLGTLVERDVEDAPLFSIGLEIQRIRAEADELQHAADELQVDLEEFTTWLADPSVRAEELQADVDAIEDSFAEREDALETIADDSGDSVEDPGERWAEIAVGNRVSAVVLADVRVELADLQRLAELQDGGPPDEDDAASLDAIEGQVADLADRRNEIGERLDELARPAWRERFDDRLAAVDDVLADVEPPVSWGELQVAIDDARP